MVGEILIDGTPAVRMNDRGHFEPVSEDYEHMARMLELRFGPQETVPGDHHMPLGVAALGRAAAAVEGTTRLAKPIPPLPEGVIS